MPAVFDARRPILSSGLAASYPFVSVGTMNVEIPLAPRRAPGLSVRTMIIMRSAVPAFVAHALAPFSTQSLPSFVACDCNDAASEPDSGSDSAKPARISPRAIGLSQRSFCSGVPLNLTPKEFLLLAHLARSPGEVISRSEIAEHVWEIGFKTDTNVVDVVVRRLRAKVDDTFKAKLIHTIRGVGYVLKTP